MRGDPRVGVALVLLAAALWGTTGTAQTFGSGGLSPLWFGALRLAVAAAFFVCYAALTVRPAGPGARLEPMSAGGVLAAGLCMAVYNLAFFAGVRDAGVAVGTAVALGSGPVWAGLLQSLVLRQFPSMGWWLGTGVAVTGGALMTVVGAVAPVGAAGIALCLLSGLSYAGYTLISKHLVRSVPPASLTLRAFAVAAALALPAAAFDAGWPVLQVADIGAVVYVGVVATGVSYLLFGHALRHISAATGVTLALAEPVTAFVLAIAVVGERPPGHAFVGLLLVLAGVLAVVRAELSGRGSHPVDQGTTAETAAGRRPLSKSP